MVVTLTMQFKAHRHRCTGGANAFFTWWRTEFPDADETSTGVEGVMYDLWNHWNTTLSGDIANETGYADTLAVTKHPSRLHYET